MEIIGIISAISLIDTLILLYLIKIKEHKNRNKYNIYPGSYIIIDNDMRKVIVTYNNDYLTNYLSQTNKDVLNNISLFEVVEENKKVFVKPYGGNGYCGLLNEFIETRYKDDFEFMYN